MKPFKFMRAAKADDAVAAALSLPTGSFIAGGTTLVDLMKEKVMSPELLVDINALPFAKIEESGKSVRIGAMARNSDLAEHPLIRERYPMLSEALLSGASQQIRNTATVGGNLLQRTRCYYFRDPAAPCNKRQSGSGCGAMEGFNRIHAVLGGSSSCIATHPSDMCVAMAALDATIHIQGKNSERSVPITDFYKLPGDSPDRETVLDPGDLIVAVELPEIPYAKKSRYLKVRDRASYEFALSSAAVALDVKDNHIQAARIALGGVATIPWRAREAEKALLSATPDLESFQKAAEAEMKSATPHQFNAFKIDLAKRTLVRALTETWRQA